MENLSHSRHPNRLLSSLPKKACNGGFGSGKAATAAYDEVFGGPPRFGAPTLSPRLEDYCEIFGGFNGASRAAVSSIPVLDLPLVDERDVYFDVRGPGFDYREVFGGFDDLDFAPSYEELLMERSEVGEDDSSDEAWTPEETESISGGTEHSGKSHCFSNGRDSCDSIDGSTEFNISYNKAGEISYTNMSNGVIHVPDLGAVPGYTISVDEMAYAGSATKLKKKPKSFLVHGDTSGYASGNEERTQKYYSRATSFPSETFVTVSDINLKTQPSEVPPPSRPPPLLKRDSTISASNCRTTVSEGSVDGNSPRFFDVETDASSAAVREAMEYAQARINGAKENLGRKSDGLRITVNPSLANERMTEEGKFSHCNMKLPAGFPEVEKNINVAGKPSEDKQGRKSLPFQGYAKVDGNDEWKEATQFFELVRTEKPRNADESSSGNYISLNHNAELPEQKQNQTAKGDMEKQKERRAGDKEKHEFENSSKNHGTTKVAYDCESHEKRSLAEKGSQEGVEEKSRTVVLHVEAENKLPDHGESEKHENLVKSEREENGILVDNRAKQMQELKCEETNKGIENKKEFDRIRPHPRKTVEKNLEYVFEWEESARKLREALGLADNECMLEVSLEPKEDGKKSRMADGMDEKKKLKEALERIENENRMKETREKEEKQRRVRETRKKAENAKRLKGALEQEEKEKTLKEAREREENEWRMKELEKAEQEKRMKEQEEKERRLEEDFEKEEKNWRMKEARDKAEHERKLKLAQKEKEQHIKEACEKEENERKIKEARKKAELERRQKEALEQEQREGHIREVQEREENERRAKEALEKAENEKRLKAALEQAERERRLKQEQEENEKKLKEAIELEEKERKLREALERAESDRQLKEALEQEEMTRIHIEVKEREESENEDKHYDTREENKERLKQALERDGNNESQREALEREKTSENPEEASGKEWLEESLRETSREDEEGDHCETLNDVPAEKNEDFETRDMSDKAHPLKDFEKNPKDASRKEGLKEPNSEHGSFERNEEVMQRGKGGGDYQLNGQKVESTKLASVIEENVGLKTAVGDGKKTSSRAAAEEERVRDMAEDGVGCDQRNLDENKCVSGMSSSDIGNNESKSARQQGERGSSYQTEAGLNQDVKLDKPLPSRVVRDFVDTTRKEAVQNNGIQTTGNKGRNLDEILAQREKEVDRIKRERELQMERLKKLEEEREREREREKDRMAFDQRALGDARERLEKACAEAREKSLADTLSAEARLRAERAAVERATAEARERAAEKAALEARERMERSVLDKQFQSSASFGASRYQNASAYAGADVESPQRYLSRLERHNRTADRVAKALAEKNMRDLVAQREQAERNRLAETLDADVKRWSSGKEGNIRALLSTLQYILGPESGWQPIPLTEVITSAAVKKAYRKATLCVHPDKLQQRGANIQQKYICEKVFDLLKEAWNRFNSEER